MPKIKRLIKDVDFGFDKEETKCGPHIAYTLPEQGGAASGLNDAYLFKAEDVEVNEHLIKALKALEDIGLVEEAQEIRKDFGLQNNKRTLLNTAIKQQFADEEDWIWLCDFNDTHAYFSTCKGIFAVAYTYDSTTGMVVLEKLAQPVAQLSMFVQVDGEMMLSETAEEGIEQGMLLVVNKALASDEFVDNVIDLIKVVKRKEGNEYLTSSAYAYVPDATKSSTWKLRMDTADHVRAAVAAMGKGLMGNKVQIPEADLPAVKRKLRAAYKKFFPTNDMPSVFKGLGEVDSDAVSELNLQPADNGITKNNKKEEIMDIQEVLKSAEFVEFLANREAEIKADIEKSANDRVAAAEAKAEEVLKAAHEEKMQRLEKAFSDKVESLSFIAEESRSEVIKGLVENYDNAFVVEMFELLKAAQAEITKVKEEFATSENGLEARVNTPTEIDKSVEALIAKVSKDFDGKQYL